MSFGFRISSSSTSMNLYQISNYSEARMPGNIVMLDFSLSPGLPNLKSYSISGLGHTHTLRSSPPELSILVGTVGLFV